MGSLTEPVPKKIDRGPKMIDQVSLTEPVPKKIDRGPKMIDQVSLTEPERGRDDSVKSSIHP